MIIETKTFLVGGGASSESSTDFAEATIGDKSGGNYSSWNTDGELRAYGDATQWEDVNINPVQTRSFGSNPDVITIPGTSIKVAGFDDNTEEEIDTGFEIPHAAKQGGVLSFHVHWSPTNTNTGVVRWGLEYVFFDESGTPVTSSTTIYCQEAASGTAWQRQTCNFADITIPSELGMQFAFRFFRDASNAADTYNADAAITSTIGGHIELDSLGSNEILVKY
jgi:hypothetical protein